MTKGRVIAAAATVLALTLFAGTGSFVEKASAQYPPPRSNLTCAASQVNVTWGGIVTVSARLFDDFGNPLPNHLVYFSVSTAGGPYLTYGLNYGLSTASAITDFTGTAYAALNLPASGGGYSPIAFNPLGITTHTVLITATADGIACQASVLIVDQVPPVVVVQTPPPPAPPTVYRAPPPPVYKDEVLGVISPPKTGSAGLLANLQDAP